MATATERLCAWFEQAEISQLELSKRLGCHHSYIPHLLAGEKLPGRRIAHALERETESWSEGPIQAEEWDVLEDARDAGKALTGTEDG